MADAAALEARHLTLSWDGGEHIVVEDVSLSVAASEVICLVGRSGCGKTTILHALSGLTRPLKGEVLLGGESINGIPGKVSYMLQKDLLLPNKTIEDNVSLPLVLKGMKPKDAREKVAPLFDRFGLEGTQKKWPSQLSGGMRQRAAFLRTYVMGNPVVLLDEPFSALDALTRTDLRSWYCDMARGLGIATIAITHDVDEAVSMSDRIYVLGGNPSEGIPSKVVKVIGIERCGLSAEAFALKPEFLAYKKEVLALLK